MYTHAQATLVICELLAMTDDSWLVPYCEKAIRYLQRAQGSERLASRFKGDSDTSVTGWCLMALISGRSAGIKVQDGVLKRVSGWLGKVDSEYGTEYSYVQNRSSTPPMTAEGLLCRMYLGWPRKHPASLTKRSPSCKKLTVQRYRQCLLLLVLRYPGHASRRRQGIGELEPTMHSRIASNSSNGRARIRELATRFFRSRQNRW